MQKKSNGGMRMDLKELRESFEEFSYTSESAGRALKKIAERLRS